MARIDEFEVIASFSAHSNNYMVIVMCDTTPQSSEKWVSLRQEFTINSRDIFKGI